MLALLITLVTAVAAGGDDWHPAVDQGLLSQIRKDSPAGILSTSSGAPVSFCEANSTLNEPLILNAFFLDLLTQQIRERTVGRSVHTKGAGAFGYFEVTHDISHICRAKFLSEKGKRTPVAVRFSPATAERSSSDLARTIYGFAVKFYTEEGNLDLPCINVPRFFAKDPRLFPKFVHTLGKHPSLYFSNPMALWDMIIANPESLNAFLIMFGDRGIPASYRHISGHNIHTLQVENEQGEQNFVRWHLYPAAGIRTLGAAEAQKLSAADPDYYATDLWESIKKGIFPRWIVSVQIVTEADIKKYGYSLFDITRSLDEKLFPLHPVGKIVLDRNPKNYNAEIEQLAFCPGNLVNGMQPGAPDIAFQARRFAYKDAQMHRLGPDAKNIPVNCPLHVSNEPVDSESTQKTGMINIIEEEPDNFDQAGKYFESLTSDEQTRTVQTITAMLSPASPTVQEKVIELLTAIHADLGDGVAQGINGTKSK